MLHKNAPLGDNHIIHNWEPANLVAREAIVPTSSDKGKLAWQKDTNVFYFLANDVGPVWLPALGVEGPPGADGADGSDGLVGDTGAAGADGDNGTNGTNGTNGLGVPAGGTAGQVLSKIDSVDNNTQWSTPAAGGGGGGREILIAARIYYVRVDGSDANTGLVDSAGGAFLTIQKAVDVVASLDMDKWQVTIQLGDGTYTIGAVLPKCRGILVPIIQGNLVTIANTHINTSATSTIDAFSAGVVADISGIAWMVKHLKITTNASRVSLTVKGFGNILYYSNINFGVGGVHMSAYRGGVIEGRGNYWISGGAYQHMSTSEDGLIMANSGFSVIFLATLAFSNSFASAVMGGRLNMRYFFLNLNGFTCTGTRYTANSGGVIITNAANVNFFPGNTIGSSTGGEYY